MKILFTSDLHLNLKYSEEVFDKIQKRIKDYKADVLAITGDLMESPESSKSYIIKNKKEINIFDYLSEFGIPVVFCLGNHEFAYSSVEKTMKAYEEMQNKCTNPVYCLDVKEYVDIDNVRFYGNVLWYNGSMCPYTKQHLKDFCINHISEHWLDHTIKKFDAIGEFEKNIEKICKAEDSCPEGMKKVLLTHTCPIKEMNWFYDNECDSLFNTYSGVLNLFENYDIYPDLALCGHTHKSAICNYDANGKLIKCINSGNDYYFITNDIIMDEIEL